MFKLWHKMMKLKLNKSFLAFGLLFSVINCSVSGEFGASVNYNVYGYPSAGGLGYTTASLEYSFPSSSNPIYSGQGLADLSNGNLSTEIHFQRFYGVGGGTTSKIYDTVTFNNLPSAGAWVTEQFHFTNANQIPALSTIEAFLSRGGQSFGPSQQVHDYNDSFFVRNGIPYSIQASLTVHASPLSATALPEVIAAGKYSLFIPYGATYSSASGVFTATPVPEPETCAMMLVGLGMLGVIAGRRRQA
jgi:hypothetical protein